MGRSRISHYFEKLLIASRVYVCLYVYTYSVPFLSPNIPAAAATASPSSPDAMPFLFLPPSLVLVPVFVVVLVQQGAEEGEEEREKRKEKREKRKE